MEINEHIANADEGIACIINDLSYDLRHTLTVGSEEYMAAVECIAKLRASMNPTVIQKIQQ